MGADEGKREKIKSGKVINAKFDNYDGRMTADKRRIKRRFSDSGVNVKRFYYGSGC